MMNKIEKALGFMFRSEHILDIENSIHIDLSVHFLSRNLPLPFCALKYGLQQCEKRCDDE